MLSKASHLAAPRARPFAALRVTSGGTSSTLRCAQGDMVRSLRLMPICPHFSRPYRRHHTRGDMASHHSRIPGKAPFKQNIAEY